MQSFPNYGLPPPAFHGREAAPPWLSREEVPYYLNCAELNWCFTPGASPEARARAAAAVAQQRRRRLDVAPLGASQGHVPPGGRPAGLNVAPQQASRPAPPAPRGDWWRRPVVGDGGGLTGPTAAAQAAFDDYEHRWLVMSTWATTGSRTGKLYYFLGMPQFRTRWDFWFPWAQAWRTGDPDLSMLVAQRSNLNGAELDAYHENQNMLVVNASVEKSNREKGTHYVPMDMIPIVPGPSLDAPGIADSSTGLQMAAAVDQAARDLAQAIDEFKEDAIPWVAIGLVGLAGAFLISRSMK